MWNIALFQHWLNHFIFSVVVTRIRHLPFNVQGILIPLNGAQWTIFLTTTCFRSGRRSNWDQASCPRTKTRLHWWGSNSRSSDPESCTVSLDLERCQCLLQCFNAMITICRYMSLNLYKDGIKALLKHELYEYFSVLFCSVLFCFQSISKLFFY